MLQWINDRMKVIGWIFILPLALVFAVWGVHGLVDFTTAQDRGLRVNGQDVDLERLRQVYQQQIAQAHQVYGDEVPAEVAAEIRQGIVDAFVAQSLLNQKVEERRFVIRDGEVIKAIHSLPNFQIDGQFNKDSYHALLRGQGISPAEFEAQQRQELRARQLEAGLFLSSFATPKELERAAALRGETREMGFAVVPAARFLGGVKVDDAAVQAYYDEHKSQYLTPETVTLSYVHLRVEDVAREVPVDEAALRGYFDQVRDRYVEAEQRRARHILVQAGTDAAAAQKKAEDAYAQVTQPGADFAALATKLSQDAGSAPQGGDLGWAERSFFVGPFADALFAMKPGEISQPVQTQFGWHVIKLEEVQAGKQKAFEDVRAELEDEYRKAEAERLFGERQEKLDELAFESTGTLDPVAKALNLPVQSIPDFAKQAGGGEFVGQRKIADAAFSGDVLGGQNSRTIELAPGSVVVLRAADHRTPQQRALADVRAEVEQAARRQLAEREARAAAERIVQQLRDGATLEAALRSIGPFTTTDQATTPDALRFQPVRAVTRVEQGIAPELLDGAFKAAPPADGKPAVGTARLQQGDFGVYLVTAVKPGTLGADRAEQVRAQASSNARTDVLGYVQAMRDGAEIHYNPALFE
jgi:peptidyl-prolyl cis-trans isomerase D